MINLRLAYMIVKQAIRFTQSYHHYSNYALR